MSTAALSIEDIEPALSAKPSRWSLASLRRIVIRVVALAAFIVLWELASKTKTHVIINFAHVPAPTTVAGAAVEFAQAPKSARHITNSVRRVTIGFSLALLTAVPLGLLIGTP